LYTFIGGGPPSLAALEARYAVQAPGRSPDGQQLWLNWIVRLVERGQAVGFVQATVTGTSPRRTAEVAWVIGVEYQGRGYAREAVMMMLSRLQAIGVETTRAHIHPEHHASNAVARAAGLSPTGLLIEGEMRWQGHS
jgi:RimJ/RimL family protein N-acetyltransferase